MKYFNTLLLMSTLAYFSGEAHSLSPQKTTVAIENRTGQELLFAVVSHKFPENKINDGGEMPTSLANQSTYVFSQPVTTMVADYFGETWGKDWWKVTVLKADGTLCYTDPNNFREYFDSIDHFWAKQGANVVNTVYGAAAAAASVGSGGLATGAAVVWAGTMSAATNELLAQQMNEEPTAGYKQHIIPNGVGKITIEVSNSTVKFIESDGGSDISETVLTCLPPPKSNRSVENAPSRNISPPSLPPTGTYFQLQSKKTATQCISVFEGTTKNEGNLVQETCNDTAKMQFSYREKGDGWFELYNNNSKKCIVVYNAKVENEANVIQWDCNGTDNSLWKLIPAEDGYFQLKNKKSNRCLVVYNASSSNGANLIQWDCYATENTLWKVQ